MKLDNGCNQCFSLQSEDAPYPLIGHEIPLVIKLHWTRLAFNNRSQKSYDDYRAGCRCQFILR